MQPNILMVIKGENNKSLLTLIKTKLYNYGKREI